MVEQPTAIKRLVVPWERPYYIDGYLFKWDPDIVLMHLNPIPVWRP
jgi:hypothetical protein